MTRKHRVFLLGSPIIIGLVTPSLTRLAVAMIVGGIPFGTAVTDVLGKQFARGHNLFTIALIGLIPFAVLVVRTSYYVRNRTLRACYAMFLCGLLGILSLMVSGHIAVWYPLYGPGRMSSTAVLAFLFIPFYCVGALLAGLGVGRLITRHRWFQPIPDGRCQKCGYSLSGNKSGRCPECGEPTPNSIPSAEPINSVPPAESPRGESGGRT